MRQPNITIQPLKEAGGIQKMQKPKMQKETTEKKNRNQITKTNQK